MRAFIAVVLIGVAVCFWSAARAFPDGAPWGAADPDADRNCATCHFDAEPLLDSKALVIEGLPKKPSPGAIYTLAIILGDPDTVTAGFQLIALGVDQMAGTFESSVTDVEYVGAAIRSTAPIRNEDGVSWAVEWHAPQMIESSIVFHVAASAANDDGSPFGDTIHFRSYELITH